LNAARAGARVSTSSPAERLHDDAVGRGVEHHLLVGAGERAEHDVLSGPVQGHDLIKRLVRRPALQGPDRAADGYLDPQATEGAPEFMPAGRGDGKVWI